MLITISGRKHSGKSTLSKILIDKGFKKISFADPLKKIVSELYNWPLEDLYNFIKKEESLQIPVEWNEEKCLHLSQIIKENVIFKKPFLFKNRREALQYIGTEVLRQHDKDFHIKKFKELICNNINYVCDDLRFKNELNCVKEIGGISIFVFRPFYWDYSNHESEISLTYKDFDTVIINSGSEKQLNRKGIFLFENLIKNRDYIPCLKLNRSSFKNMLENIFNYNSKRMAQYLNCSKDKIVWWAKKFGINYNLNKYSVNHDSFLNCDKESSYWAGYLSADGCIKQNNKHYVLELTSCDKETIEGFKKFIGSNKPIYTHLREPFARNNYQIYVNSPFIIENLKQWCLEPKKSKWNKIPDIIKNNDDLISYWIVGLIDGDGSICIDKKNRPIITILASKQIVEFIFNWCNIKSYIRNHKGIENLYTLQFNGKYAIEFYRKIYKGFGLKRKWDKIKNI